MSKLRTFAIILAIFANYACAYQVFIHLSHGQCAEELVFSEGWEQAGKEADGVWGFDAWTRTITSKLEQDEVLKNISTRGFYMAEFHWSNVFVGEDHLTPNVVIDAGSRNGFKEVWCMTYDESRFGSTISNEQIAKYRQMYPNKVITNFRVFNRQKFAREINSLDGLCYEFALSKYNSPAPAHKTQTKLENIGEAIRWSIDNNKKIFLLIAPGKDAPAENNNYINAIKSFVKDLDSSLEDKYFNNDNLILVPATYNCVNNHMHNVPEMENGQFANTGTSATLYLLEYRKAKMKSEDQAANPETYLDDIRSELVKKWPSNRTINIVFHGHSVPTGYFQTPQVNTFQSYPHLMHKMLKEKYPFAVVNVIKTSIGGENAVQGAKRFEADVLTHKPDVLFIDYALNDRKNGLEKTKAAWEEMIEKALYKDIKVILLTPTIDINHVSGKSDEPLNQHAQQIRDLAKKYHIGLVDSLAAFDEVLASGRKNIDLLSNKYNHPTAEGHAIVANELIKWF